MIGKICEKLKWIIWTPLNRMYFKYKGVQYGKGVLSNGRIYIKKAGGVISIGNNVKINSGLTYNPIGCGYRTNIQTWGGYIYIGDNVGMSNVSLTCAERISIGENTKIGDGVKIFDTDFHSLNPYIRNSPKDSANAGKRAVSIGRSVFIGASSIILKGTCIEENSVIGAGAVVSGKIPECQVWAGNRAVFIRNLTEQERKTERESR